MDIAIAARLERVKALLRGAVRNQELAHVEERRIAELKSFPALDYFPREIFAHDQVVGIGF